MTEVGVAYLSIVPDTSKVAPAIKKALGGADVAAGAAGRSAGGRMSSALGGALKTGAAAAGAAGVAAIGTTMVKGFQRLNAIDQAKAKLSGLGNSASDVTKIMDNALASVKGTAFGMGDAASLAGVMVAAGIKPGQELESTLKRVSDSAAIAGTDLNDMGQIWGKAAAKGKIDGEIVNQLLERQIPIYDILGKKMGKNSEEIADMVSAGKISFQDFSDAMNNTVGGAALKMGDTVSGAFKNVVAAAGRLGASALEPFFKRSIGGMGGMTDALDALEPKVKAFAVALDDKIFNEWGPKLQTAFQAARDSGALDQLMLTLKGMAAAGVDLAPILGDIGSALAEASAVIGVGTWNLFLTVLQAATQTLNLVNPLLSTLSGLMRDHPALVAAAVGAWGLFRTIPGIVSRVTGATAPLAGALRNARTSVRDFGSAYSTSLGYMRQANPHITTAGAHFGVLRGNVQAVGRSLSTSLTGGMKSAIGALGGPMSAALMGAGALFMMVSSKNQAAGQSADAYSSAIDKSREAQVKLNAALRDSGGAADENVMSMQAQTITTYMDELSAATQRTGSALDGFRAEGESLFSVHSMLGGAARTQAQAYEEMGDEAQGSIDAINDLGLSTEELAEKVYGSQASFDALSAKLRASGDDGAAAAKKLGEMRAAYQEQQGVAERVSPGVREFADALEVLGDKSATASDKLTAVKSAMDSLNPARSKAEAMRQFGEAVRSTADAAAEIGPSAFKANGELDAMGESGGKLSSVLSDLAEKQQQVVASGDPAAIAQANREIEGSLQALAASTGQPISKIRELYATMGGGKNLDLMVNLVGAPQVTQELGGIVAKMNAVPGTKTVEVDAGSLSQQALQVLDTLKVKYYQTPDGKTVRVDVTGDAGAKLQNVIATANAVPPGKAVNVTAPGGVAVRDLLVDMGVRVNRDNHKNVEVISPLAPGVIELLKRIGYEVETRNGKNVIVRANDDDYQNKKHEWTQTVYKQIIAQGVGFGGAAPGGGVFRGPGIAYNANGSIAVDSFASGGLKQIEKPTVADIYRGRGAGTIFAEEETGGEAYIPLASSKRSRSTSILAAVADMFGLSLIPKDGDRSTVSGLLGGIAGGAVSKLLREAGADGLTRFADGGFSSDQLTALANGQGASRPLTGAPYVWGGINWGDCSGAMSAFTRAAAGLAPFGGRWATGSAASDLSAMGFQRGHGGAGDMRVGFYNGGPGGGHTAGTLPNGQNVEMGGGYGGGKLGGNVGANHSQFTDHFFLNVREPQHTPLIEGELPSERTPDGYVPGTYPDQSGYGGSGGGGTTPPAEDKGNTISARFGNAASAFVSGQVKDVLDVFGINDSPGALQAWNTYEQERDKQRQKNGSQASPGAKPQVKDPGTHAPKEGEDTGQSKKAPEAAPPTKKTLKDDVDGMSVKDKFKAGLREAWRSGLEWAATDWIINKESTWNPAAQNGKYHGLIQAGPEVYRAAGVRPDTLDPSLQARAFDKYVADRYQLPTKAKSFHEANNWYDEGGVAGGIGHMLKNTIKPERVLSPKQTEAFEQGMSRGFGSPELEAKLDSLLDRMGGDSWQPGVSINNHVTVSNERSQMRQLRQQDKSILMQYGGARV